MVVPYGKHSAENGRVVLLELLVANLRRSPRIVKIPAIQVIVIIARCRNDVNQSVRNAHQFIAQALHLLRVSITIVPAMHHHVLRLHLGVALGMSKCAPNGCLLAKRLHIFNIMVGEITEFLHHLLLGVGILIGSDMHYLAPEHGVLALQILLEEPIHKLVGLGIEEVEMIHAIFLGTDFRLVMGEGERMGRHIYLGDDVDAILLCQFLEFDELSLGIAAILRRESRIGVAFQAEGCRSFRPIVTEELSESIIVEMNLQGVHLVIRHHLDQRAQIRHRDELSAAIHHEASQPIGRRILGRPLWQHETCRTLLL